MNITKIAAILESILFVSGEPVSIERLSSVLEMSREEVERGLEILVKKYRSSESGLSLVLNGDEVQLATSAENSAYVDAFYKSAIQESLSKAALEVLSIIAYRGPIARTEIEAIRGVNCSVILRNLLMRELIDRKGNPDDARGYVYTVSFPFLKELGLEKISDLPDYEILLQDERVRMILDNQSKNQQE